MNGKNNYWLNDIGQMSWILEIKVGQGPINNCMRLYSVQHTYVYSNLITINKQYCSNKKLHYRRI